MKMKSVYSQMATASLVVAIHATSFAQNSTPAPASASTAAQIASLEKLIAAREKRATELANDMLAIDQRTESRVESILQSLEGVTDSRQTRDKVAEVKRLAMVSLRKCTKHYESDRKATGAEIAKTDPRVSRKELFGDLGRFDKRIEKRLDQVIRLTSSLQQPEDYERWSYKHESGLGKAGQIGDTQDPNFYQNRRTAKLTGKMREHLKGEFKQGITRMESANRGLRNKQLSPTVSAEYRAILEEEILANQDRIDAFKADIAKVTAPEKIETTPIDRDQNDALEDLVRDMAEDLERDCDAVFRTYRELNVERKTIKTLREQLEAQKKLLAQPSPKKG